MFGQDVSENCSEKIGCINIKQALECGSQNEEVVQWLEFPPSLRIGHGHTVSGLPEYITAPSPLVDFPPAFTAPRSALDYQSSAPEE